MGGLCSCLGDANEYRFLVSNSGSDFSTHENSSPMTTCVRNNQLTSSSSNKPPEKRFHRPRSISTGSSSVEVLDLESIELLQIIPPINSDNENTNRHPVSPHSIQSSSSSRSIVSSSSDDNDDATISSSNDNANQSAECDINNMEKKDPHLAFIPVTSDPSIDLTPDHLADLRDDTIVERPKIPDFEYPVNESSSRLSVEMAVKYFHGLEQQSKMMERTKSMSVLDHARFHSQKCSPRIASVAQKFGDTARHMK